MLSQLLSTQKDSVIDLERTEKYLKWRFDSHPDFKYRYILAEKEETVGYAVISLQRKINGYLEGMITDYVVLKTIRAASAR